MAIELDEKSINKSLTDVAKKLDEVSKEHFKRGFKKFDTWYMSFDEMLEIYEVCLKQNKSYEEIYGEEKYDSNCDY